MSLNDIYLKLPRVWTHRAAGGSVRLDCIGIYCDASKSTPLLSQTSKLASTQVSNFKAAADIDARCGLSLNLIERYQSFIWSDWCQSGCPSFYVLSPVCSWSLWFTSGATPAADLLVASMAREPFLIHVHLLARRCDGRNWACRNHRKWNLNRQFQLTFFI